MKARIATAEDAANVKAAVDAVTREFAALVDRKSKTCPACGVTHGEAS